jgi:hydrogenase expression/formation protein HypC
MCLAIPAKVIKIEGKSATVEIGGVSKQINIELIDKVKLGDYLIVHTGFALQKLDEKEANITLSILKEMNQ